MVRLTRSHGRSQAQTVSTTLPRGGRRRGSESRLASRGSRGKQREEIMAQGLQGVSLRLCPNPQPAPPPARLDRPRSVRRLVDSLCSVRDH